VALPGIADPGSGTAPEHVPARDRRPRVGEDLLGERRACVDLAALLAVRLTDRLQRNEPLVQALSADAERVAPAQIRARAEAVQRHRDVDLQPAQPDQPPSEHLPW